jgi:hypothetical protein
MCVLVRLRLVRQLAALDVEVTAGGDVHGRVSVLVGLERAARTGERAHQDREREQQGGDELAGGGGGHDVLLLGFGLCADGRRLRRAA